MTTSREAADNWARTHIKPVTNLDSHYQQSALSYNTANSKQTFLAAKADLQACEVAFKHGMASGIYYGGSVGFLAACYYRQIRYIPKYALASGLTYGLLLGSSAWFRFDV